ncbi:MAG: Fur family transcriptional regulator [Gemmatimonadota bacterium]
MREAAIHREELEPRLRAALELGGHRFTAQRAAVFQALDGTRCHPTADEIFTAVRERIPDISLATVYKALEAFVSCGLALKLTLGPGPARYDSRTDQHDHVRCIGCGRVADVGEPRSVEWLRSLERKTDYQVVGYRLELVGYCPTCRN